MHISAISVNTDNILWGVFHYVCCWKRNTHKHTIICFGMIYQGTVTVRAVAQWLRCCATNRNIADRSQLVLVEFLLT
jgi:hypothetical protein